MGLFDKVKSNMDSTIEKNKEEHSNSKKSRIDTVEAFNAKILEQFNIYKGLDCKIQFPQKELILKSHSGLKRSVATLGLGLVGFAATSNIKQEKRHIIKDTQLQIADKGVVFKKVTNEGKDLRIPYDNIISFTAFTQKESRKDKEFFELLLLENQSLFISLSEEIQSNTLKRVSQELVNIINSRATGKENEDEGWGLDYTNSKFSSDLKSEKITTKDISSTEELEKIANMYEKGLLTDEEFIAMKKKIIEN